MGFAVRARVFSGAALAFLISSMACAPAWTGPASEHFDGARFHSLDPVEHSLGEWLRREATRHQRPWRAFAEVPPGPPPPERVDGGVIRVTFVNHSTVLIQMDGINVLTDPTWSENAVPFFGPRRRRPPGLRFGQLPPIDAVLISHDHHDHMDLPTLRRLAAAFAPAVPAGLGTARYLRQKGIGGGRDLDWWQSLELAPGVSVTAVPARHTSGRGMFDRNRRLWCGFVLAGPSGAVYFAGDTGFGSHFAMVSARFPGLRVALLPIGGFVPEWYMHPQHMSPRDAVRAAAVLGADTAIPVHFGTFPQSDDGEDEPLRGLSAALTEAGEPGPRFAVLANGESLEAPLPGPAAALLELASCLRPE
jgi:L-ascorbate metabolism protein UlaG (beta-lactamase superfamily)